MDEWIAHCCVLSMWCDSSDGVCTDRLLLMCFAPCHVPRPELTLGTASAVTQLCRRLSWNQGLNPQPGSFVRLLCSIRFCLD